MKKIGSYIFWTLFFGVALFLTFNKHSKSPLHNYQSEVWADKAGYYVYLPLAINYKLDARKLPDSISIKTGDAFFVDSAKNKLKTKYTCGVAIMQTPFYIVANSIASAGDYHNNGFSKIHYGAVNIAAVFYLILGLYFLRRFLTYYYSSLISYLTVAVIFLATNLYYYAIDETGMSHVYSFALFSVLLFWVKQSNFFTLSSIYKNVLIGVVIGLIILIRPTNIVFLSIILFLDIDDLKMLVNRFKNIISLRVSLPVLIGGFIILLPQFLYWKYAFGSYLNYSYQNEHFNWFSSQIAKTFFSPNNGLFLYTPFYVLILLALILMIKNKVKNSVLVLGVFITISYIFSCWWDWSFGCSFGARSYVEYLALFSIPVGYLFSVALKNKFTLILFSTIVLLFIAFNFKMIYSYDECFWGSEWDWQAYKTHVFAPTK